MASPRCSPTYSRRRHTPARAGADFPRPARGHGHPKARNAFRISPPVDDLQVLPEPWHAGRYVIGGDFACETEYTLRVAPGSLTDQRGRAPVGPARRAALRLPPDAAASRLGRLPGHRGADGPQMVPVRGHGYAMPICGSTASIRSTATSGRSRRGRGHADADAPPLPGNEPDAWDKASPVRHQGHRRAYQGARLAVGIRADDAAGHVSGADAKFGLDLEPLLARIAGPRQPGTYLVGLRPLDGASVTGSG